LPSAPAPLAIPFAPNLANTIDGIYTAVEPWVRYGFEVATSIVRWIPYVGWFAGQIMVFYNFFESMVASGVFNFTDFLRGDGGIGTNLVDFGIDVGLAFVWLGLDEVAQFIPLPPFCCYPPRPPVQGPFLAADALAGPTETADTVTALAAADATLVDEKRSTVKSEDLAEAQDATTDVVEKKAEVDAVKEAEEPKEPKEPRTTDVSAQGEVRSAPDADSTESMTVSNDDTGKKKADNGPKVKGTTDSSTSASDDNKKSDDTGKKDKTE
jgi:hypothetical protein